MSVCFFLQRFFTVLLQSVFSFSLRLCRFAFQVPSAVLYGLFFTQFSRSASDYADVLFPSAVLYGCSSVSVLKSFIQAGPVRVALSVIALGAAGTLTEVQQRWECVKVKAEDDIYSDLITSTYLS